jgi:acetoin utilization deacetylase AcuC-like enzyme
MSSGLSKNTWTSTIASANLAYQGVRMLFPHLANAEFSRSNGNGNASTPAPNTILALCRPPGHHCDGRHAGGYCYINNVAVAVSTYQSLLAASQPSRMTELAPPTPSVNVETRCAVPLPNGLHCKRDLACNQHSWHAKRSVRGRSAPFDQLLQAFQAGPSPTISADPQPTAIMPSPPGTFPSSTPNLHASQPTNSGPRPAPRIAILDLDFHHGNGTQELFYSSASVLYISIHGQDEFPYYTGHEHETGIDTGLGYNLNLPLPRDSSFEAYLEKLQIAMDRLMQHKPEFVVVSLGFDTYETDPLGKFRISTEDYATMAATVKAGVKVLEGGKGAKSLIVLEGGYVIGKLGENMLSFLKGWEGAEAID